MSFNLKTSRFSKDFSEIIDRQFQKRDLHLHRLRRKGLKELEEVYGEIQSYGIPQKYVKKKLKGNIGYGIFLQVEADPILKGEIIALYTGQVILEAQMDADDGDYSFDVVTGLTLTQKEQKKFDPRRPFSPRRLYDIKVDATKIGNFTRFINHSHVPNIVAFLVDLPDAGYQILYKAQKKIRPGEQLLVNYEGEEESYWAPLGIKPYPMTPRTFCLRKSSTSFA
ncbi:MAG: hypothetical protein ACD_17C00398G0003 [uncultured bacterium]|nr:MAG: hypothetical protein ACD_17C00398G0003 [uncultured bacterium]OGN56423.1 MAG: hypothetical protein A2796_03300 [Chlamydiae bacterium RIFCSPHIGHO2_01_FULL_44_39]OGN58812.1 MAG: hypothetical protein A3C42_01910 [Chlamydiae bacterium RIFCSPHIGHO2_02_FULL_45_9]OGN60185.1 MAG: hypothetical protein A3D96_05035 [Chlamydiae bacterium RIFCSPHIGHO2_12_FULL_44_59]OGN67162.1 MAG: hypothetical protein A2978_01005 [Chlamydiae bacterium RIFCSPLOWO2_01_FULL_44_52]OGN67752.1 MAG: hypothetical protein A3